jgi:DNA-binding response OmpR family regulator
MRTLLLADASPMTRRLVELSFAREAVRIVSAANGLEVMALARRERPDVVLVESALPGRSGYEIASLVGADPELAQVPVVLLAGAFESVDDARAERCGCAAVLVKPLDPREVVARVSELIEASRASHVRHAGADSTTSPHSTTPDLSREARGMGVEELFERLEQVLGARRGAPVAPSSPSGQAERAPEDLPTIDRVLGHTKE